jgi:amino acid transporter
MPSQAVRLSKPIHVFSSSRTWSAPGRSQGGPINRNPTAKWRVASALIAIQSFVEIAGAATSERRRSTRDGVMAIAIVLYVIFCLLAGLAGSQRRMGFFGTFLLSLVITPLLASLLLIFTRPSRGDERDRSPQSN